MTVMNTNSYTEQHFLCDFPLKWVNIAYNVECDQYSPGLCDPIVAVVCEQVPFMCFHH